MLEHIIKNPAVDIYMLGFMSNTFDLGDNGWEISAAQSYERDTFCLALHHKTAGLFAVTNQVPLMQLRNQYAELGKHDVNDSRMYLSVQQISSEIRVHIHNDMTLFEPAGTIPHMITQEIKDIKDFNIFGPADTEEIIVRPESVPELMAKIITMQEPNQQEIKKRLATERRRREFREKKHATIISIAS